MRCRSHQSRLVRAGQPGRSLLAAAKFAVGLATNDIVPHATRVTAHQRGDRGAAVPAGAQRARDAARIAAADGGACGATVAAAAGQARLTTAVAAAGAACRAAGVAAADPIRLAAVRAAAAAGVDRAAGRTLALGNRVGAEAVEAIERTALETIRTGLPVRDEAFQFVRAARRPVRATGGGAEAIPSRTDRDFGRTHETLLSLGAAEHPLPGLLQARSRLPRAVDAAPIGARLERADACLVLADGVGGSAVKTGSPSAAAYPERGSRLAGPLLVAAALRAGHALRAIEAARRSIRETPAGGVRPVLATAGAQPGAADADMVQAQRSRSAGLARLPAAAAKVGNFTVKADGRGAAVRVTAPVWTTLPIADALAVGVAAQPRLASWLAGGALLVQAPLARGTDRATLSACPTRLRPVAGLADAARVAAAVAGLGPARRRPLALARAAAGLPREAGAAGAAASAAIGATLTATAVRGAALAIRVALIGR